MCRLTCVLAGAAALGGAGCLSYEPAQALAIEVVEVAPTQVGPMEPIVVRFAAPLPAQADEGVVSLWDEAGAAVPATTARLDAAALALRPAPAWPAGGTLRLAVGASMTAHGVQVIADPASGGTETSTQVSLRGPAQVPPNARWLLLAGLDEGARPALTGRGPPIALELVAWTAGRALAQPVPSGPCAGLCPGEAYAVSGRGAAVEIRTATVADRWPPTVTGVDVQLRGDLARVHVHADEPVVVRGAFRGPSGVVPLAAPPRIASQVVVDAATALPRGEALALSLEVEDVAGNVADVPGRAVQVPVLPRVRITEVVVKPLRDWSDSEGGAVPFDGHPGVGAVNDNDEWVELVNEGDAPIDLLAVGLALHAVDTSPSVTFVDGAPGLYFGAGGGLRGWRPGEALVVRPRGSLSQRSLTLSLFSGREQLDQIAIGDLPGAVHANGSPPDAWREAIARGADSVWRWCAPTPGDPAPARACGE